MNNKKVEINNILADIRNCRIQDIEKKREIYALKYNDFVNEYPQLFQNSLEYPSHLLKDIVQDIRSCNLPIQQKYDIYKKKYQKFSIDFFDLFENAIHFNRDAIQSILIEIKKFPNSNLKKREIFQNKYPLFVKMLPHLFENALQLNASEIRYIVSEIRESNIPSKKDFFKKKYPRFANELPKLFENSVDPKFKLDHLDYMLDMREKIDNESEFDVDTADSVVYKTLQDKLWTDEVKEMNKQ